MNDYEIDLLARQVWGRLQGAIEEIDEWTPSPSLPAILSAIRENRATEEDAMEAAIAARLVIQRQGRAPKADALFAKILREGVFDDDPDPDYVRRDREE